MRWMVPLVVLLAGCAMPVDQEWVDVQREVTVSTDNLASHQGAHCAQAEFGDGTVKVWKKSGRKAPAVLTERFTTAPGSADFATTGLEATADPMYDGQTHSLEAMFGSDVLATVSWDNGKASVDGEPVAAGWERTFNYEVDGTEITEVVRIGQHSVSASWHRPGMCE